MRRFITLPTAVAITSLALAGCGSFSPRPDPSRFFALTSLVETEAVRKSPGAENISPRQSHRFIISRHSLYSWKEDGK